MGSNQSQNRNNNADYSSSCSDSDLEEDSDDYHSLESDIDTFEAMSNFTVDASYTKKTFRYPDDDDINLLDNNLDLYEKISMVYLLYDNASIAYDILQNPLNTVIKDWCHKEAIKTAKWNWKLLEALAVIKNFRVLRMIGYNKSEMLTTFLPLNSSVTLEINAVRKALFCIFEKLTRDEVDRLLFALQKDLINKRIPCYINNDNLELTFLHMEKFGYISLNNLSNLCRLFKSIDMLSDCEHLKTLHDKVSVSTRVERNRESWAGPSIASFSNEDNSQNVRQLDYLIKTNVSKPADNKGKMMVHVPDTEDFYHMDSKKPGLLLIINNEAFYTEFRREFKHLLPKLPNKLDDRAGTKADKDRLLSVFESLEFEVVVHNDVTHEKIDPIVRDCIKRTETEKFSSFFVAILSHGDKGVVYGSNSIPVEISAIQETMCSQSLSGKPKVLLVQACQGEKLQEIDEDYTTDGPDSQSSRLASPPMADMLVFYATIPNFSAIRHLKYGTWFIQSLCEKITTHKKDHFEDICTKVKQDIANKRWGKRVMVALTTSTLQKKLYLTREAMESTKETVC